MICHTYYRALRQGKPIRCCRLSLKPSGLTLKASGRRAPVRLPTSGRAWVGNRRVLCRIRLAGYVQLMLSTVAPRESPDAYRCSSARRCCFYTASAESRLMQSAPEAPQHCSATMGLSVILWAGHIMRDKSHGYADEEETKNGSIPGSGPRAAA
jgi:hypothetical protein